MTKCSIIQDLLNTYVSGHGSADSRALVDEHIGTCPACQSRLTDLQNRVAEVLRESDAVNVNAFKSVRRKILRKNILIGLIASILAVTIVAGALEFISSHGTPMKYEEGLIWVEKNPGDMHQTDMILEFPVLNVFCAEGFDTVNSDTRIMERDGELINVVYFYFTETLKTKWSSRDNGSYFTLYDMTKYLPIGKNSGEVHSSYPIEIYYLIRQPFWELHQLSNEVYYSQRKDGVLVWSGMLEQDE